MKQEVRFTSGKMIGKLAAVLDTNANTIEIRDKDSVVIIKLNSDVIVSVLRK